MAEIDLSAPFPLHSTWNWYVHATSHGYSYSNISSFDDIRSFFCAFNNIPKAASSFVNGKTLKVNGVACNGYSIFRGSVLPEWEDAANATGKEWSFKDSCTAEFAMRIWEEIVFAMIGEQLDEGVTGARIVFKSGKRTLYKVELWMDADCDADAILVKLNSLFPGTYFMLIQHGTQIERRKL